MVVVLLLDLVQHVRASVQHVRVVGRIGAVLLLLLLLMLRMSIRIVEGDVRTAARRRRRTVGVTAQNNDQTHQIAALLSGNKHTRTDWPSPSSTSTAS